MALVRTPLIAALSFLLLAIFTIIQLQPATAESARNVLRSFIQSRRHQGSSTFFSHVEEVFSKQEEEKGKSSKTSARASAGTQYLLGVGKADITGAVVEINFAGYADSSQIGTGLRQRQYARTFIIGSPTNAEERIVYMILDMQSGDTAVRYGILDGLAALGSEYSMYTAQNVAVVGTHSHSGPGAWFNYLLPDVTSLGFDHQTYNAIVQGCVLSVQRAHQNLTLGSIGHGTVAVEDANINRSPSAYLANPAEERAQYSADVDKTMDLLVLTRASDGKDIGILNWFPVHGTSLYGNNTLATGDNKGIAMRMFEDAMGSVSTAAPGFVAGFSQANVGDTTPNVLGAWCEDGSNVMCSFEQSLCSGKAANCHGRGPNFTIPDNGQTSGYTIGYRQYAAARSLYDSFQSSSGSKMTPISGAAVRSFHFFQNMTGFTFTLPNGTEAQTCAGALGYGFAAGTSDWPGYFDFKQGDNSTSDANPVWLAARAVYRQPSPEQIKCQGIKPILLDVGEQFLPYEWAPQLVDMQVMRVGQLFMIISPSEATTMSGRRWKAAIAAAAARLTDPSTPPIAVLGGPANSYSHYMATEEEYQVQRYEGASTLYGPHQLNAYINLTTSNLQYLADAPPAAPMRQDGGMAPNNVQYALDFILPVVYDTAVAGRAYGDVLADAPATAAPGQTVNATFVAGNPRNDFMLEGTYAMVQRQANNNNGSDDGGAWEMYRDDADYELVFHWARIDELAGTSNATVVWIVPAQTPQGTYRLGYNGAAKTPVIGTIDHFSGYSRAFTIL